MPGCKKKRESVSTVIDPNACAFCNLSEDNEETFGKMIKKCNLTVHYFCMLFSSGLSQGGKSEKEGIFGFMPEDIMKEVRRGARLRCTYCKQKGATIGCVVGACRRVFHFGCGKTSGTMHQYYDSFRSFCEDHRPRQMVSVSDRLAFYGTANTTCAICMTSVETRASNETLRAPCCHNSWFHRSCISKHAMTAGLYFFKCPLCNNKEIFQEEMLKFGIYLPDQDAAWETEPDAFRDLLERYLHCDAKHCHCPKGRDYNQDGQKWEIIVCSWCGSQGSHVGCHSLSKVGRDNVCQDCKTVEMKISKGKKKTVTKEQSPDASNKNVKVDLDSKCKSEYPGKSDKLIKKSLPARSSTLSSPPASSALSPGTVLRLSYEETDDELNVVDSIDCQPSTSNEYDTGEPSKSQQKKRKKSIKNTTSKRQKISEDVLSVVGETVESRSPRRLQPSATIPNPKPTQVSPVKSNVRQSALDIQLKRARTGFKRTRSVGLTTADALRLEKIGTDSKIKMKKSISKCVVISPKKKSYKQNPWNYCKGCFSKKKSRAAKKKSIMELKASSESSDVKSPFKHFMRSKNSKGQFCRSRSGSSNKQCVAKNDILNISSTSSCIEDSEMSDDDSPVRVNTAVKSKGLLRALLTSGTESECDKSGNKSSSSKPQNAQVKRQPSEHIPKTSKKTKSKKSQKSNISPGQMSITNWLTGMNGPKGEGLQTVIGTEKGNVENNINFLNKSETENDNDEKSLVIKYKGKKFMLKKSNHGKSERTESECHWSKSDKVLCSVLNNQSIGTSPAQSTRQALNEEADALVHLVTRSSRPVGSSPALSTRQALTERRQESVERRKKRVYTPKTFPRKKSKKIVDTSDSSDLSDNFVYGTPRRSVRCSLNTKFQDNFGGNSEADEVKETCFDSSPSTSSDTSLSTSSDLKLLYFESDVEEEEADNTSMKCGPEGDTYQCLLVDLGEEEKTHDQSQGHDSSCIALSDISDQTMDVVEIDSTGAEDSFTSTYIIQSFGGNHGFQQLSISVPSV
ncbi:uncharacterized protein DDB_G0284459-like [Ylistrum balloti]|uniref:uncharacterized protein DDB_G0284459-like n=1 Tax=Ylistrum balloti TaxID=509963 RepID=UPI002905AEFD|nr:uncharacterized protein DDB_G0284459-like [Ylistrum balloti]